MQRLLLSAAIALALACPLFAWSRLADRDIYDVPLPRAAAGADTLRLDFGRPGAKLSPGRVLRAFVVHVQSGGKWYPAGEFPASKNGATVYIPFESVKGAGAKRPADFSALRVSAWGALTTSAAKSKKLPRTGLPAARFVPPSVGVVANGFSPARVRERINAPLKFFSETDIDGLRRFSAAGGKIVVANSGNEKLAAFMGVVPGKWRRFDSAAIAAPSGRVAVKYEARGGFPPAVPPRANPRHARVAGWLCDSYMRRTDIPGAVATDRGVWYTHAVPPPAMTAGTALPPRDVAIRGVWSNGAPLDPRGWSGMAERLAANGFNTLFIRADSPYLRQAIAECRKHGVAVHAWLIAFGETKRSPDSARDRLAVRADVARLLDAGVDGVQLDYFRYGAGELRTSARQKAGAQTLTTLLSAVSRDIAARRRRVSLSVAVLPSAKSRLTAGQDVPSWMAGRMVDFVSPMCYTESAADFATQILSNGYPAKTVIGIGGGANESRLDAAEINTQMRIAAKAKLRGFAIFRLDAELAARIPPRAGKKKR